MFCQSCGMEVASSYKFCPKCGGKQFGATPVGVGVSTPPPVPPIITSPPASTEYAGFGRRLGAYFLDSIIGLVIVALTGMVGAGLFGGEGDGILLAYLSSFVIGWLYFAILESGPQQATFGKRWLGCKVTDEQGQRLSFAKASGRYFAKMLSGMILAIGYLMVLWTEKRQGLHDKMAGTYVLYSGGR